MKNALQSSAVGVFQRALRTVAPLLLRVVISTIRHPEFGNTFGERSRSADVCVVCLVLSRHMAGGASALQQASSAFCILVAQLRSHAISVHLPTRRSKVCL